MRRRLEAKLCYQNNLGLNREKTDQRLFTLILTNHLFNREKEKRFDIWSWGYFVLELDVFL